MGKSFYFGNSYKMNSKLQLVFLDLAQVVVLLLIPYVHATEDQLCQPAKNSQYGHYMSLSAYKTLFDEKLGTCFLKCHSDSVCSSINYNLANGKCEHNHVTRRGFPSKFVRNNLWIYGEAKDPNYGTSKELAVSSCKRILELQPKATSGNYWIRIGSGSTQTPPIQVYCDMTIDGGGWTLVYSYRFTNFANFGSVSNAITPIPSWTINKKIGGWSPQSTTVPLSETSYSAMDFALWKNIGSEFLIKPNIVHWIACKPGTGDLVNWRAGSISCKVVRNVATVCLNSAPSLLKLEPRGPALFRNGDFYMYMDGNSLHSYPAHDPCAKRSTANHVTNIASPGGAIYIR